LAADAVYGPLDGELVESRKRQAEKQADPAVEQHKSAAKGTLDLFGASGD
jgi:hypothetical protein